MAKLIAIDLGTWAVKVTVLEGSNKGHEIEGRYVQRVPQDGDQLPTMEDRLASLDLLLREHPDWTRQSVVAAPWPTSMVSTRLVTLPFDEDAKIEQTLPFAIESETPFDLDEMVLAWQRHAVREGPTRIRATLVREDSFSHVLEGLEERSLDPRDVHVGADVLSQHVSLDEGVVAAVDVGHHQTIVSVIVDGRPEHIRSIRVGGHAFTRAIQAAMACSWHDAEQLKHAAGEDIPLVDVELDGEVTDVAAPLAEPEERTDPAVTGLPAKAREALASAMAMLLSELRSTLIAAEDHLGLEIEEVLLGGGGSKVPDLQRLIGQDLGVPVHRFVDADEIPVPIGHELSDAAAIRLHDGSRSLADLRVGPWAFRGGLDLAEAVLSYGGAAMLMFVAAVLVMFGWQYVTLEQELGEVNGLIAEATSAALPDIPIEGMDGTSMVTLMIDVVSEREAEAAFLGDGSSFPPTVHLLHQITEGFPAHPGVTVNVESLDVSESAIVIKGLTDSFASVDSIQSSLEQTGLFSEVAKQPGTRNNKGQLNFTLNLTRGDAVLDDTDAGGF